MLHNLRTELSSLGSRDRHNENPLPPSLLEELEKLPYLGALVREGLRLSNGVASRMPRMAPDRALVHAGWMIPPGTAVSMTHSSLYNNETIFPDSFTFSPERFLPDAAGPKEWASKELYFAPFERGASRCLGKQ